MPPKGWAAFKAAMTKKPAAGEAVKEDGEKTGLVKKDGMAWVRRKDVVEKHNQEYHEEQKKREEERERRREAEGRVVRPTVEKASAAKNTGAKAKDADRVATMPKKEVVALLRERGEPVTLFGETDVERCERLRSLMTKEVTMDDLAPMIGGSLKERMEKATEAALATDKIRLEQGQSAKEAEAEERKNLTVTIRDKAAMLAEQIVILDRLEAVDPIDPTQPKGMRQAEVFPYITAFTRRALLEWELQLLQRPSDVVKSFKGRKEHTRFQETSSFLEPLLKALASKEGVETRITIPLRRVVFYALRKQYIKAMDEYIVLSVGRAQWPLGVTQVGIHDRVGRDRISADKQTKLHLMTDETTRKFVTAFKRLVTQLQEMHPPDVPSQRYTF